MSDSTLLNEVLPEIARHRTSRRRLLAKAAVAAGAVAGSGLLGRGRRRSADAATLALKYGPKGHKITIDDRDVLNFALNLEYLEAEFYQRAAFGAVLGTDQVTGTGTQGTVNGGGQVPFADPLVQQYAQEIATDELNHVLFLRSALGTAAVARPSIDFTNAFSAAAVAATVVATGGTFDPFDGDTDFLLGAYLFEDVGVTAYQGASAYIRNSTYLQKAAGILAVEGYHASSVRTTLYRMSIANNDPTILNNANLISSARETLSQAADSIAITDEGLSSAGPVPNIVPANGNGMTYPRSFQAVLNIVYLGGFDVSTQTGTGGFFPNGMNGRIH